MIGRKALSAHWAVQQRMIGRKALSAHWAVQQRARACTQAAVSRIALSKSTALLRSSGAGRAFPSSWQHRLFSQKVEARVGDAYQKGQLDKSTELVMEVSLPMNLHAT